MDRYIVLRYIQSPRSGNGAPDTGAIGLTQAPPLVRVEQLSAHDVTDLRADPEVLMVVPSMPMRLIAPVEQRVPPEAPLADNWGIAAVGAHASAYDGSGVSVAVLDTGIDSQHPAFAGMQLVEKDFSGSGNGDRNGHGTHCAGTLFGRNDGARRIGIARGVQRALIGKVVGDDGAGQSGAIFQALSWALQQRADIVSMSLGFDVAGMIGGLNADGWPQPLALANALEAYGGNLLLFDALLAIFKTHSPYGTRPLLIAAAGNESRRDLDSKYRIANSLPAAAADVLSVAAVERHLSKYRVARFSSIQPRLAAPGVDITSAWPGGGLRTLSGTSMACPHVAGVAALWWQCLRQQGIAPTARNVSARLIASARKNVFVPETDESDVGQGLASAP